MLLLASWPFRPLLGVASEHNALEYDIKDDIFSAPESN